jgi:FtsP/CotA-like multicopper oxidase with cupredoxin domain
MGSDILKIPIESFLVKANKKYLFRVIGANSGYATEISFQSHKITVVATDGNRIKPIEADSLILHGGERYDIELQTKNESFANNFLIVSKLLIAYPHEDDEHYTIGLLKYENADPISIASKNEMEKCNFTHKCIRVNVKRKLVFIITIIIIIK